MEVSVRELKNRLSEYLRRAQAGEEIAITSRGRPVGRLLGPQKRRRSADEDALTRLRALPFVRPGNGKKLRGSDRPVVVAPGTTEEILRWVRGE